MTKELHTVLSKDMYQEMLNWCKELRMEEDQFLQEAVGCYLKNCKQEKMKYGYEEMNSINAEIAEFSLGIDVNELCCYESQLDKEEGERDDDD